MAYAPPPPGRPSAPEPSAAAAAGAAAAALLQRQLAEDAPRSDKPNGGWTEHQTGDGRKFFFHEETQISTWEKPSVLMTPEERKNDTPWREYRIWDGRVFYHNGETKVSCWSMPPEIRRLRGESSGIDETPLPQTNAERRRVFWDHLRESGIDDTWTWARVDAATANKPEAQDLPLEVRKQCFTELLGFCQQQKMIEARERERNAANALGRLIEDRFGKPEDLGTSYEEAASLLENEGAWQLIKSDMRRDEVFQNVMERLEEKHAKTRTEKRSEQAARLQRLMATDAELKRPRLRWKDAAAILSKRDELFEEDPPLEALRVWASLRLLKPSSEHEQDAKRPSQPEAVLREERKRRDAFIEVLRDMARKSTFSNDMPWSELQGLVVKNPAYLGLTEGPGATAMELFDEFQEELARGVSLEEVGFGFEIDLATPPPPAQPAPPPHAAGLVKGEAGLGVKNEAVEPAAKRARVAPTPAPAPVQPGMQRAKEEISAPKAAGLLAAKTEAQEGPSPLDQLLAAADAFGGPVASEQPGNQAVSTPLTKEELLDPSSKKPASGIAMAKEEVADVGAGIDPLAVPAVPALHPKKTPEGVAAAAPAAAPPAQSFTSAQLMAKKVDDLRELCRARGLQISGRKQELVDRLTGS